VAHKDKTQDVKKIVDRLKSQKRAEGSIHRKVFRPWGWYDGVDAGERFQVKRIVVKPGGTLSCRCTTTAPSTGLWSAAPPR
jgi:mannose-1-phosphate guanylyltransferase/mannose-6-phosphate isomerase